MNRYEKRRLAVLEIVRSMAPHGRKKLADIINKDPSYVSRMLYPEDKAGKKRIGDDLVAILDEKFPGWIDRESAVSELGSARNISPRVHRIINSVMELRNNAQFLSSVESIIHMASGSSAPAARKTQLVENNASPARAPVPGVKIDGSEQTENAETKSQHL